MDAMTGTSGPTVADVVVDAACEPGDRLSGAPLERALLAMWQHGFVQIDDAFPAEFAARLASFHAGRHGHVSMTEAERTCLKVGDKRYMMSVALDGAFNDPRLYASPFVLPALDVLLNGTVILSSFGIVSAFPGAATQHVHADHPALFPEARLGPPLPCYAVTVVVPLVDLTAETGGTAVWLRSHRDGVPDHERDLSTAFIPQARVGSVYLMDYRLVHAGLANRSDRVRPILYIVYSRPWFNDYVNFRTQPRLRMSATDLRAVPDEYRRLFSQVTTF